MNRRALKFDSLDDAVEEARRLLEQGYQPSGNWSLGQACRHLRITQDASIDGYPRWMAISAPLRPMIRWLLLSRLLQGSSPAGLPTAPQYAPPADVEDEREFLAYAESVTRFMNHEGYLHPHPGFGKLDQTTLERFHAAHAAHHFGFLLPAQP